MARAKPVILNDGFNHTYLAKRKIRMINCMYDSIIPVEKPRGVRARGPAAFWGTPLAHHLDEVSAPFRVAAHAPPAFRHAETACISQ